MADQKISELTALTGANVADDDAIAIVDTSATETKKIVFSELKNALDTATGFVRITGDTMTGALDVQSTITSDGLTVDGNVGIGTSSPSSFTGYTNVTLKGGSNGSNLDFHNSSGTRVAAIVSNPATELIVETNEATPLLFKTNSTERMRIDSSGNVGIGTDAPTLTAGATGIDIYDNSDAQIRLHNSTTGTTASDGLLVSLASDNAGYFYNYENAPLIFGANSAEAMRIDSSGNVGIGTSLPTTALQIVGLNQTNGTLDLTPNAAKGSFASYVHYGTNGDWYIRSASSSGNVILQDTGGNVGIGTDSPSANLHVNSSTTTQIRIGTTSTGSEPQLLMIDGAGDYFAMQKVDRGMTFKPQGGEAMRIDSSGNVGIGTDSPTAQLTSYQSLNGDPKLGHFYNDNSGAAAESVIYITNSSTVSDGLFLQTYGASATTTGGFVQDASIIGSGTGASGGLSIMTRANADMRFYTNGHTNERMRIDSSGNVGIGVTPEAISTYTNVQAQGSSQGGIFTSTTSGGDKARFYVTTTAGYVGTVSNQDFAFLTNDTERMRIDSSGHAIIPAGVTLGTATGVYAAAKTLDDYEEGTWTPALTGFTVGNGTATGFYTKVGNLVTLNFRVVFGSTSTQVGSMTSLTGFPFTVDSFVSGYVDILDAATIQYSAVASGYTSASSCSIRGLRSSGTYVDTYIINATTPITWTTSDSIMGQLTYRAG